MIALLSIELMIPWAQSLKDKRSAVRGLKDRLQARFNASVVEVGYEDKWQRATLAVCMLGSDKRKVESDLSKIRTLCEEAHDLQLLDIQQQWL